MMKVDLSDRFIAGLKGRDKPTDYFDKKARGLNLRVTPNGVKAWSVMFTSPEDGKRARLSLGTYPATSLATARTRAIEARGLVEDGKDPRQVKKKAKASESGPMTVRVLADEYLTKYAAKLRGHREIRRKLDVEILPVIGDVALASLHRRDIHRVLDRIKERGSISMSSRTFTDIRSMLSWAVERGYLDNNPAARMKEAPTVEPRERYLSEAEIALLWPALSKFKKPVELALKLALVTGQRIGEICGMTEGELELAKNVWIIPSDRCKNGYEHTVPLSDMALSLIAEARTLSGGTRLLNCTPDRISHVLGYYMDSLPVQGWRPHDLRRTMCSHLAELGFSPMVIGSVVNHRQVTQFGVTNKTYIQYTYDKEKRQAVDAWADRLAAIVSGDAPKIIPIRPVDMAG